MQRDETLIRHVILQRCELRSFGPFKERYWYFGMLTRKRTLQFLYLVFMALLIAVAAEVAGHVILKNKDFNTNYENNTRHVFHPYRSHALNPDYYRPIDSAGSKLHSSDGFRSDHAFDKVKKDGVFRVIMMGGSTLYGFGADAPYPKANSLQNDETISSFIQTKLTDLAKNSGMDLEIEVINAGVAAYRTFHHVVYFNESLYEYDADLVVFLDGNNDFYFKEPINSWQDYRLGTVKVTEHWNQRDLWFTSLSAVRFLAKYSRYFLAVERYMQQEWQGQDNPSAADKSPSPTAPSTPDESSVESIFKSTVLKSYVQMQALSNMYDFDMMVFMQPQVLFEDSDLLSSIDKEIQEITVFRDEGNEKAAIRPLLAPLFEELDIPFYDVGEIASSTSTEEQLYLDYCHLTPLGSEIVADRMAPIIFESMIKSGIY